MAITSAKGKASLAKAAASHAEQKAAKQPGENKSTKGLGQIQAEAMGAPKGTSVAGGYLLSEDTKAGTQLPKVPQLTGDEEVDTSQPSPENVEAGASLPGSMVPEDQAIQALQNSGQSANDIKMATALTKNRYQQAHEQLKGTEVSQDAGLGKIQVQGAMTPAEPDMSPVDQQLAEDPGWNTLTETYKDYFDPDNQKASLMDTYKKEFRKLGLDDLDEEIIDAQTIIDGTEDDIRNEVEQAGGFATDSQVQALSLSRNKVLLKNYNQLVALRESKTNQLDMMMDFAEKDRAYADSQFDRMTNYQMQMLNYRDKFIQNARDQYDKYEPAQLYAMLSNNPRQLAFAESILGVGQGGLAKLASAPLSLKDQLLTEQIKTEQAQRAKIYTDMAKATEEEGKAIQKINKGVETAGIVLDKVTEALGQIGPTTSGLVGQIASSIGGTQAFDLASAVETIQANIGFDTLQAMRDASPTGGALGQVSEREISLLQSTVSSLKIGQRPETLKKNLEEVATHYKNWLATVGYTVAPDGNIYPITD